GGAGDGQDRDAQRRRAVEVEQVFQRVGVRVAAREVWDLLLAAVLLVAVVPGQEALLDQREQRRVVADRVRDIARLGERRDGDEGDAEPQLVERRALLGEGARRIRRQRRAQRDRVGHGV